MKPSLSEKGRSRILHPTVMTQTMANWGECLKMNKQFFMKLAVLLMFHFPFCALSQTKDEIIKQILKINRLESEERGLQLIDPSELSEAENAELNKIPNEHNNYENFQALKKIISHQELVDFTENISGVLRMFAIRALISQRDNNYDYFQFFVNEIKKNEKIESQWGCDVSVNLTSNILLSELSNNWNIARSEDDKKKLNFLNKILRPIDSFILVENKNFNDNFYFGVFSRKLFGNSMNGRVKQLIDTKLNFAAFEFMMKTNPKIFDSIKENVIDRVIKSKVLLLDRHPQFFEGYLRYMVTNKQFEKAKQMIQAMKQDEYFEDRLNYMLMGIDKELVNKVK